MTKDDFIGGYCERSRLPWAEISNYLTALPCACGDESCDGWAMVSKNEHSISTHMYLYAPDDADGPNV